MARSYDLRSARGRLRYRLSPVRALTTRGLREGVFGDSRVWLGICLVYLGLRFARRLLSRTEETVAIDRLAPGQTIVVRAIGVRSADERKRLLRG
jgi:hypothetical protein